MSEYYASIGYGIDCKNFRHCSLEGVKTLSNFCSLETRKKINDCDSLRKIADIEDDYGNTGVLAILSEAIWKKYHVQVIIASDDDRTCAIFEPYYPWQKTTNNEKNLTIEKLNDIFQEIQNILDIPEEYIAKPGFQTLVGYC